MAPAIELGIVSLGEAGNLGDDLILVSAVEAIFCAAPDARVRYLSFGQPLDWDAIGHRIALPRPPVPVRAPREVPGSRRRARLMAGSDLVIFGGGGLLQTSHDPHRPFQWVGCLPEGEGAPRVVAVGLGVGPLSRSASRRLRRLGSPFDEAYLRDDDSLRVVRDTLLWPAARCEDFVSNEFLARLTKGVGTGAGPAPGARRRALGVALRSWPGLDADNVAQHVQAVAADNEVERIVFFVLEDKGGFGPDIGFVESVRGRIVGLPTDIWAYAGGDPAYYVSKMTQCDVAVSMKLHACAIWASRGIPIYPIIYAPKVAAFFGVPYHGLVISADVMLPVETEQGGIPSAGAVVRKAIVGIQRGQATMGARLSTSVRVRYQVRGALSGLRRRVVPALGLRRR